MFVFLKGRVILKLSPLRTSKKELFLHWDLIFTGGFSYQTSVLFLVVIS
jgi:hypothetical protein